MVPSSPWEGPDCFEPIQTARGHLLTMRSDSFQNRRPLFCGVLIRSESVNNMKPDHVIYLVFFPACVAKMAVTFVIRKVLFGFCGQWLIISTLSFFDFVKKTSTKKGRIKVEKLYRWLITCPFVMQWKGKNMCIARNYKRESLNVYVSL